MSASRPRIALCTALERARWSVWDQEAVLLPVSYVEAVRRAGAGALLLAPEEIDAEGASELLDAFDGLLLAGGADIEPSLYGAQPHPETVGCVPQRDRFEIALVRAAVDADLPLLGICRGMQVINVACGGTLYQHLPSSHGHHEHRRVSGSFDGADHDVRLQEGSLAARVCGAPIHHTKSHHHQGVDRVGDGLVATGWAVLDDLTEAIEMPGRSFVLGVQWHPEADDMSPVIPALVESARERAALRAR